MNMNKNEKLRVRIRNLWQDKKSDLNLTQKSAASRLGMSQPAFSNYLKDDGLPINTDFILRFCDLMEVKPVVITADLINAENLSASFKRTRIKVTRTLTGRLMEAFISLSTANTSDEVYAIKVDVVFDILKPGQYLVIDQNVTPRKGDYVVKITEDTVFFGTLVRSEEGWYVSYHVNGAFHTQPINRGDTVHFVDSIKYADNEDREALSI